MAVNEFIQPTDVRMTVQKEVKPKPSISELTTIESPGKPISAAEFEENNAPEKKRKTPKPKRPKGISKEEKVKRDSLLIITEKPQAAAKIADALGKARKYSENNVPFYELERNGKKIIVASAVGHLFGLTYSKGQSGWPIFKLEWEPSFNRAAFTKNYYNLLKKLAKQANEFIVATDYDIEGEVIGWNVLRFLCGEKDAKRMKYSTLTKKELEDSYENALPTLDWGQAYAGETRHEIDWLYGINLSRALMSAIKKTGSFKILSIGRVQGPALKIIVDREREIESFKSEPYWNVYAHSQGYEFKHPSDIMDKNLLKEFEDITEADAETKKTEESHLPPVPFDLTTLQREAYRLHNISPAATLKIAQSLYLDGLISYPRTSSQKIPQQIEPKKILKKLTEKFPEANKATRSSPMEGPKEDPAHPSIYPTGEFKRLDGDEEKLYNIIARRFIAAFSPDAKTANKRITLTAKGKKFTASALTILEKGWLSVYPIKMEESTLPDMKGKVKVDEIKQVEKETQPPHRYTPASLVSILEKKNLGTKATRSSIVETLFDRGYLDGKSISATPLGRKLIDALEKYSPIIIDENLTRDLEEKMEDILVSKEGFEQKKENIVANVERLITDISKEFKAHELEIGKNLQSGTQELRDQQKQQNILMRCPVCNQGNLTIKYAKASKRQFVACDKYPECKTTFSLPPNAFIKRTDKISPEGLPILIALRKGKRPWEFPFDPHWREKQAEKKEKDETG